MSEKYHNIIFRNCLLIALLSLLVPGCGRETPEEPDGVLLPDHIGKARFFYHRGNYSAAADMYHKALEFDPDNAATYLQLGIIYDDNLKNEEQAVYFYNQFLIRDPDSDKAERVRGWIAKSTEMLEDGNGEDTSSPARPEFVPPAAIPPSVALLPTPAEFAPPTSGRAAAVVEEVKISHYTVKSGDTLAGIAEKFYGTRSAWKRIYQANRDKLANPNALQVGQELIIPAKRDRAVIDI